MKTYIVFIMLVCFSSCSVAQPPVGTTVYHTELNKFTGRWQWVNNGDTITLKLNKENIAMPGFGGEDYIIGYHLVKHGDTTIESSLQYGNESMLQGHSTIVGGIPLSGPNNKTLKVRSKDITKNKDDNFELALNSDNTQLTLTRFFPAGGMRIESAPAPGYTIPDNIVFQKVVVPPTDP